MSISFGFALRPLEFVINKGVNFFTRQYAARHRSDDMAAIFHYNVKAGIYNTAAITALLTSSITVLTASITAVKGKSPFVKAIGMTPLFFTCIALYVCAATHRSMEVTAALQGAAKGVTDKIKGKDSSPSVYGESGAYLFEAKADAMLNDLNWKESLVEILGVPILKRFML